MSENIFFFKLLTIKEGSSGIQTVGPLWLKSSHTASEMLNMIIEGKRGQKPSPMMLILDRDSANIELFHIALKASLE